jgi:hypothetical protein
MSIRDRVMPMFQVEVEEYRGRVPDGYPLILDDPATGAVGIALDPSHAIHFVTDGDQLYADFYYRSSRYDARSSASREKFAGSPFQDRRVLPATISDQGLRNLIAELNARFNWQGMFIHITDT